PPPHSTPFPYTTLFRSDPLIPNHPPISDSDFLFQSASVRVSLHRLLTEEGAGIDAEDADLAREEMQLFECELQRPVLGMAFDVRSEEHTSELQSRGHLV